MFTWLFDCLREMFEEGLSTKSLIRSRCNAKHKKICKTGFSPPFSNNKLQNLKTTIKTGNWQSRKYIFPGTSHQISVIP